MTNLVSCKTCNYSELYIDGRLRCDGKLCKEICDGYAFGTGTLHKPEPKIKETIKVTSQKAEVKKLRGVPKPSKSPSRPKKTVPKGQGSLF